MRVVLLNAHQNYLVVVYVRIRTRVRIVYTRTDGEGVVDEFGGSCIRSASDSTLRADYHTGRRLPDLFLRPCLSETDTTVPAWTVHTSGSRYAHAQWLAGEIPSLGAHLLGESPPNLRHMPAGG